MCISFPPFLLDVGFEISLCVGCHLHLVREINALYLQWTVEEVARCSDIKEMCGDGHGLEHVVGDPNQTRYVSYLLDEGRERVREISWHCPTQTTHLFCYGHQL